jgi:C4-dicarboxylate transporter DctM subunit
MMLLFTALVFVGLLLASMPIVFALGISAVAGLWIGGYPMEMLPSSIVSGSQNWVLLAIPSFVFAGSIMERCGMSHALVNLARAMVGWVRGGLGTSVILVSYLFSDLCGAKIAEVSALSSTLLPSLTRAGYKVEDSVSIIAAGTAMGMLVPPAIFMIVIASVTNVSAVALFLAGFIPAAAIAVLLCLLVFVQAHLKGWPKDMRANGREFLAALRGAAVPLIVPIVILGGFYSGAFTATEAGAVVAFYALLVAKLYYRNVSWKEIAVMAYESGMLTASVIFLTAVATIFQYLLGVAGVPQLLAVLFQPLTGTPWLFLMGVAFLAMMFGMVLEGLPAAVVFVPVVFPIASGIGINPIHFDIVQTAAVGIGLFLPPLGIGLLMALRFAKLPSGRHFRFYWPYLAVLILGLVLIICVPELSLFLPRQAGFIK